jgi:hypothetical protein
MNPQTLIHTVRTLVANGKGLLAMDESIQSATNDLRRWAFLKRRRPAILIAS